MLPVIYLSFLAMANFQPLSIVLGRQPWGLHSPWEHAMRSQTLSLGFSLAGAKMADEMKCV